MNTGKSPSLLRIVQVDYVAMLGLLFPLVCWVLFLLLDLVNGGMTRAQSLPFLLAMGIIATAAGLTMILVRWYLIASVFWNGAEVSGQVAAADFVRDRGRIEFVYHVRGETFRRSAFVHKTRLTDSLCPGMNVIVIVDRSDPRRALIRDFYC